MSGHLPARSFVRPPRRELLISASPLVRSLEMSSQRTTDARICIKWDNFIGNSRLRLQEIFQNSMTVLNVLYPAEAFLPETVLNRQGQEKGTGKGGLAPAGSSPETPA
jgi:hypothetical protein